MNLGDVLPFFANQLSALGLKEYTDGGINPKDIPSNLLDQAFSLEISTIQATPANQLVHAFSFSVTVKVYFKEYRNPNVMRMQALSKAQAILQTMLNPKTRLTNGFKDIRPTTISVEPLSNSNDHSAILTIGLDVALNFQF